MTREEQDAIIQQAIAILKRRYRRGTALTDPSMTKEYLTTSLTTYEQEVFVVIFLDNRHRIISKEEMFRGTIDGASVYPREVVKAALRYNAAAVIVSHNHPSGICEPSHCDEALTKRLKEALSLVDVRLLDHFICAGGECMSFAERGLL